MVKRETAILGGIGLAVALLLILLGVASWSRFINISAETWSAIAAFFSLGAALYAMKMSRVQSESSERLLLKQLDVSQAATKEQLATLERIERVKTNPYLHFDIVTTATDETPVGVYLRNTGNGPAIMVEWIFFLNGQEVTERNRAGLLHVASQFNLNNRLVAYVISPTAHLGADCLENIFRLHEIPAGIELDLSGRREHEKAWLFDMIKRMNITVIFKSIFGDQFEVKLHDTDERW